MKFIVYCTTNIINSKIYIGVHKTQNPEIFDGYLGCGVYKNQPSSYMKPTTAFLYAVKKYGTDKFYRSILYIYNTKQEALLKEKELVTKEFISLNTNYNMTLGDGEYNCDLPINLFDVEGKLIKEWEHESQVVELFNCSSNAIHSALSFKEKLFGFYWSRDKEIDVNLFSKGDSKKPVYKYLKSGKLISRYDSLLQASKDNNISISSLVKAIQGNSLVNKEFYYSFTLYDEFIPTPKKSLRNNRFYIYSLEGEYIQTIDNSKELMKFMDVKSWSSIWDVIHRRKGIYKEYQIRTTFEERISPTVNKSKAKQVDVYDKTGTFIKTCLSVLKAAKEFNAKASSINRVLRGLANTTAGYIFKFH